MEEQLREKKGDDESLVLSEVKKQLRLAGPLVVGCLLQSVVQMISVMFVSHLGELALSGVSMATSFANVTGFSLMAGMACSLDTLCGQAYGAGQHRMLGVYKQRAMVVLSLASVPVAALWAYTGEVLLLLGQDPEIAAGAGSYIRWMIPALLAYGQLQCHVRFLQTQNVVVPVMLSSAATALNHPLVCWALVHGLRLGSKGAALANAVSFLTNLSILALYVRLSPSCARTWTGFSHGAFRGLAGLLKLAVPSALMVCNEEEVAAYVARMMPILAMSIVLDALQCVLSGVVRGSGQQKLAALGNLGAYYIVGIPAAFFFAFIFHLGGMGLWFGIICGLVMQLLSLLAISECATNWEKEAMKAKNKAFSSSLPEDMTT